MSQSVLEFTGEGTRDALFLHGYQQSNEVLYIQLKTLLPLFRRILIPNAPYPVPYRHRDQWQMGFSWYFFDRTRNHYFIEMDDAARSLAEFVEQELQAGATVIGFSQGGYVAPFVAEQSDKVGRVIGLNCRMREEAWKIQRRFRIDQIHALGDDMVDFERSKRCFEAVHAWGHPGGFHEIEGSHLINSEMRQKLEELIRDEG